MQRGVSVQVGQPETVLCRTKLEEELQDSHIPSTTTVVHRRVAFFILDINMSAGSEQCVHNLVVRVADCELQRCLPCGSLCIMRYPGCQQSRANV